MKDYTFRRLKKAYVHFMLKSIVSSSNKASVDCSKCITGDRTLKRLFNSLIVSVHRPVYSMLALELDSTSLAVVDNRQYFKLFFLCYSHVSFNWAVSGLAHFFQCVNKFSLPLHYTFPLYVYSYTKLPRLLAYTPRLFLRELAIQIRKQ